MDNRIKYYDRKMQGSAMVSFSTSNLFTDPNLFMTSHFSMVRLEESYHGSATSHTQSMGWIADVDRI